MNIGSSLPPEEPATVFYIGQHGTSRSTEVPVDLISAAHDLGYDFLTTLITTAAFHDKVLSLASEYIESTERSDGTRNAPLPSIPPLTPEDTCIAPNDSNNSLVAVASPWIDLGSPDPVIKHLSRQVLNAELSYAAFCGISNVIIHGPLLDSDVVQYARAIQEGLGLGPYLNLHILLPFTGELEQDHGEGVHLAELLTDVADENVDRLDGIEPFNVWDSWNTIRTTCAYSHKLSIALELPRQLPSINLQSRWLSEPVRILAFPRTSFLRNAKGYPVLSKQHQQLFSRFARFRFLPWMLLSDVESIQTNHLNGTVGGAEPTPAESASMAKDKPKDPAPHLRYLRHLQHNQPPRPPMERFGQGYQDYLQSPLQPLTDNLESITYEVFEKDPVKYEWYEKAICAALRDLRARIEEPRAIVVAVAGAGRGPLVTRSLQASQKTGIDIDCWAVEKNPNAYVLLQRRNVTDALWNGKVTVVKSDMRYWPGPETAGEIRYVDILVSELLGSFADNELSPECLDGVQHVLHPEHGVSIPQSYSAHFTPIATPRIYGDLLSRPGTDKWELPWVVMLHMHDYLCTDSSTNGTRIPQVEEAWSFSHPISAATLEQGQLRAEGGTGSGGWVGGDGKNEHNSRTCKVVFLSNEQGVCHGLAGYFETVLYASQGNKIELSTNPVTMEEKSEDMISWFPIFFPLKTPIYVPKASKIVVSMWRQTDDRNVWYEWIVEVISEVSGRKTKVAISELHSSRKNGCLM